MAKNYVASSWRNSYQQNVVSFLRNEGHEVYDFTHPNGDMSYGFSWSSIDPKLEELEHSIISGSSQPSDCTERV